MIFNRISSVLLDINESLPCLAFDALLCTFKNCCVRKNKTKTKNLTTTNYLLLVRLAAAPSSDGHRLAVLVEASSTAVNVGVGGGCHWLLPRPDGFGWAEEEDKLPLEDDRLQAANQTKATVEPKQQECTEAWYKMNVDYFELLIIQS